MHRFLAFVFMLLSAGAGAADGQFDWGDLIDPAAQTFDDPYRDLSYDQMEALVTIVRMRTQLSNAELPDSVRARIEVRLDKAEAALVAAGIDIDWLIAQRWVVAEKRKRAASRGNPAVDGVEVLLAGFVIPAPPDKNGTLTAYLVPERGMCSHMPPPPPNQLIRIVASSLPEFQRMHEPVIVRGRLEAVESNRDVFVVDGPVPMWSAWTLNAENIEIVGRREVDG
ncbi:DUF3299 domain-containing protein [Lutimaribacter marinistellae]|uniref:DUF3299 domain-containing protein n=1 Tax=Lutimaribacter marinistellae TaxID=1820329 RepID=A0ABV7T9R3_9RHOB